LLLPDCWWWAVRWIGSGRAEAFPFAVFMWSVAAMVQALARSVFGFGAERGWTGNWARQTAMLIRALAVVPIVFASRATHLWTGVLLVGLAAAAHQGWSANIFTTASDMFPRLWSGRLSASGAWRARWAECSSPRSLATFSSGK